MTDPSLEERSQKILEILKKREANRLNAIENNLKEKETYHSVAENLDLFQSLFSEQLQSIESRLSSSATLDAASLPTHYDTLFKDLLVLQKYVSSCSLFLRTYDIKTCMERVQILNQKVKENEEMLLPKKKFGFKNRKKTSAPESKADVIDFAKCEVLVERDVEMHDFQDITDERLELKGDAIYKRDISIAKLKGCTVHLLGSPATVHATNLRDCTLICGPCSTSIFVNDCCNCTLVVACQQLRLHSSSDLNIYLHVTSKAIIEDCVGLKVAPYNLVYIRINDDYEKAGLDRNLNNWDKLDDFNWLSSAKRSPNWSVMPLNERIPEWIEEEEEHFNLEDS